MKYPYTVKFGGKWYPAGDNVPENETACESVNLISAASPVKEVQSKQTVEDAPKKRGRKPKQ